MKRAVVAGADGGLGRAFVARMKASWDVVALSRDALDVSRRNAVFERLRELRPQLVIDCAAVTDVDLCETDKWRAYLVNRDGAEHLARAAAEADALLLLPGCDLIFDGAKSLPYREEDSPNPLSIYGDTKLAAELAVMSHAPKHLIVRTGWLFGPHGRNLLTEALQRRQDGDALLAPEEPIGQPCYQPDVVDACLRLVMEGKTGLWHVAPPDGATPLEFARELWTRLGGPADDLHMLRRGSGGRTALRPRYAMLDVSKLGAEGIRLRSWRDALAHAVSASALSR
ncbi:MAG TPA: NAD(P)-dependent oxidoreductase [Planctomycetota bacterium]|nr:NAD(P)-dependent oxidoreductase [Planctomycetota bacterium]